MTLQVQTRSQNPLPPAYPFDWSGLEDFAYPRDERGLPMVRVARHAGLRHHPITIAQFGLARLRQYAATRAAGALEDVKRSVAWLQENVCAWRPNIGAWVFDFDEPLYGLRAPWISGMAQGQGISLLLRAGAVMPLHQVEEMTRRAFEAFLHPVSEGGVAASFPDGGRVFEEYPSQPPSHVLNGHVFALIGVYDFAQFWGDKAASDLFAACVDSLKTNLWRYDTGYWNLYDLHPTRRLASPMYVQVHVRLLRVVGALAGDPWFAEQARRWQRYLRRPLCRARWFAGKVAEKVRLRV